MPHREAALTSPSGPGGASAGDPRSATPLDLGHRASRRWGERVIALLLFACGLISVLTTVGIVVVLVTESAGFFREVPSAEFLTGTRGSPMYSGHD